jgi:ABC-type multidrug transport system ATPase subunit
MLLCGESILTEGGLDRATGLIGVCPQFDVLWGELTGMEHLLVAAHVKGLPWAEVGVSDVHIVTAPSGSNSNSRE